MSGSPWPFRRMTPNLENTCRMALHELKIPPSSPVQVCADVHEIAPVIPTGCENLQVSSEVMDGTVLHAHSGASLIIHDEIKREVLDKNRQSYLTVMP